MIIVRISPVITRGLGHLPRSARPSWACTLFKGSAFWPTARWRRRSGPVAVGQADLVGLAAAAMLVTNWTHLRARLIQAQQAEAEATGTGP